MLSILRRLLPNSAQSALSRLNLPPDHRVYCVGDIHGRCDLLVELHRQIEQDLRGYRGNTSLIYLGDYLDRGSSSAEVIDTLLNQPLAMDEVIHLRGNHEQAMLDFLQNAEQGRNWLGYGGLETLLSYRATIGRMPSSSDDLEALRERLSESLPPSHLAFLQQTPLFHSLGDCLFVHAGINPNLPLTEQRAEDLLWIKEGFTLSEQRWEKVIIHGHTISEKPEVCHNRIGLDTGAFLSGILTCGVFEKESLRFLQTGV